jgi:hypothetical protein
MVPLLTCLAICASGCGRHAFDPIADGFVDGQRDGSLDGAVQPVACPADPQLIACYTFDNDVLDHTGNGNDAIGSAISFVPGVDGQAVSTTADSRLDLTTPNIATTRFTIEAWVRLDRSVVGDQLVFDHESHWAIGITDDAVRCVANGLVTSTRLLTPGVWAHIACTHDGTDAAVWIHGQREVTMTTGPYPTGVSVAAIAGNAPATDTPAAFLGEVDRLRIWNVARTAAELCAEAGC